MTTQKTFKRRVRARAAKTGESYTAARAQLVHRAAPSDPSHPVEELTGYSDEMVRRRSGRSMTEWLELLDTWGATERRHPEIARWLADEHGVSSWYAQTITVGYERARGLRALHEQATGFSFSVTRTIAVEADHAIAAFTEPARRHRWLPDAPMRPRTTRSGRSARFDWDDPPSRVVMSVDAKPDARIALSVTHERLPDAAAVDRLKPFWRDRLDALKLMLEERS